MLVDIPSDKLVHVTIEGNAIGNSLVGEKSLIVMYREEYVNNVVCFSGNDALLKKWEKIIIEYIRSHEITAVLETCPICGKQADRERLLKKGCSRCGWVSHKVEK